MGTSYIGEWLDGEFNGSGMIKILTDPQLMGTGREIVFLDMALSFFLMLEY